ncbi:MAG: hypothetical protein ABI435_05835 [Pseudolysinimonas sp.]
MKRNGLIIAGGVIAILRGIFGTLVGLGNLPSVNQLNLLVPGYTPVFYYELLLSIAVLIIGIYSLVKAIDPGSAGTIRILGIVIIAAGVVDGVWALALLGGSATAIPSALGSVAALALIGGLLLAGATRLGKVTTA